MFCKTKYGKKNNSLILKSIKSSYRANSKNISTDTIIDQHLPQIRELMRQHGVEKGYAFGSAVKGVMNCYSDVDFIIRFPGDMDFVTYTDNYFALAAALEALLNKRVDLVTEKTLKNPYLLQDINSHKVEVL